MRAPSVLVVACAVLLAMPLLPSSAVGNLNLRQAPTPPPEPSEPWLDTVAPWLAPPAAPRAQLPLGEGLAALARIYHVAPPDAAQVATLTPDVAHAIAGIVTAMVDTEQDRAAMFAAHLDPTGPAFNGVIRAHAAAITTAVQAALPAFEARASAVQRGDPGTGTAHVDAPPLLAYDESGDSVWTHDYALGIDVAGADLYDNHAGGTLFIFGPLGDPSSMDPLLDFDQLPIPIAAMGGEYESGTASMSASINIDMAGNDVYGVLRTPGVMDRNCTSDLLVRRTGVQGAGLLGVGFLLDTEGDDTYLAKTFAQGSGHPGGVGLLVDQAGNDHYLAVRNAQGNGILGGGLGLLLEQQGDDTYDYYIPGPDANADPPKPGGVLNDKLFCDDIPRQIQGGSLLVSTGVLIDQAGNDHYRAGGQSQGYGTASTALLLDEGGTDDYGGYPDHVDGFMGVQNIVGVFVDQS